MAVQVDSGSFWKGFIHSPKMEGMLYTMTGSEKERVNTPIQRCVQNWS